MRILKATNLTAFLLAAAGTLAQAQTVQATFNYPLGVSAVAVDYIANRAYVLLPDYMSNGDSAIQELDGKTNQIICTFHSDVSNAIAVNVVTGTVYVGGSISTPTGFTSVVLGYNPNTGARVATIPVSSTPGYGIVALAVDPFTDRVFVSNASDNTIAIIDGKSKTLTSSVPLAGQVPNGIAVNVLKGIVYAALNDNRVAILTEKTGKLTYATYGSQTSYVAVDPFLDRAYVTDGVFTDPTLGVLSQTGATVASPAVGLFPQGVDVDFVTGDVFVANEADGTITKISAFGNSVIETFTVPANTVAVNPKEAKLYAVGATTVTVLTEN